MRVVGGTEVLSSIISDRARSASAFTYAGRWASVTPQAVRVAVVEALADHSTAAATLIACGVPEAQRPAYVKALADLARSQMIERREGP